MFFKIIGFYFFHSFGFILFSYLSFNYTNQKYIFVQSAPLSFGEGSGVRSNKLVGLNNIYRYKKTTNFIKRNLWSYYLNYFLIWKNRLWQLIVQFLQLRLLLFACFLLVHTRIFRGNYDRQQRYSGKVNPCKII